MSSSIACIPNTLLYLVVPQSDHHQIATCCCSACPTSWPKLPQVTVFLSSKLAGPLCAAV
jgi:hypothetical protein